jgi:hypothetical protein
MAYNLTEILTTVKGFFTPRQTAGRLNPTHLAVARQGYWVQSQKLHIPDRYGFFSPGPPPLQAYQGAFFAGIITFHSISTALGAVILFLGKRTGTPIAVLAGTMMAIDVLFLVLAWVAACIDHRRASDYDWGDHKLRKE